MKKAQTKLVVLLLAMCMLFGLCGMTACSSDAAADVAETTVAEDGCVVLEDGTCEDCTEEDDCDSCCCSTSASSLQELE